RVRCWQYATAGRGAPNYYVLSPLGYRLLHGPEAKPPTRRFFAPIGIARQPHTQALSEFLVHTIVAAHEARLGFTGFYRENTLRLAIGDEWLFPDAAFKMVTPAGGAFSFYVELDNSSERIRSEKDL